MNIVVFISSVILLSKVCESPKRHRYNFIHYSGCKLTKMAVDVTFSGCLKKRVITFGCAGYCKSGTRVLIYQNGILPKCDCCKPKTHIRYYLPIRCPNRALPYKFVQLLSATSCACRPCGRYLL